MTIDLDALEKLANAATFGPWVVASHKGPWTASCRITTRGGSPKGDIANVLHGLGSRTNDETRANAQLIAAANPATIKALIAELREARGLLKSWRSDLPTEALEDITDAFLARNGKGEGE